MVAAPGLEPGRLYRQEILSLQCLPFHHAAKNQITRKTMDTANSMVNTILLSFPLNGQIIPRMTPTKKNVIGEMFIRIIETFY